MCNVCKNIATIHNGIVVPPKHVLLQNTSRVGFNIFPGFAGTGKRDFFWLGTRKREIPGSQLTIQKMITHFVLFCISIYVL